MERKREFPAKASSGSSSRPKDPVGVALGQLKEEIGVRVERQLSLISPS